VSEYRRIEERVDELERRFERLERFLHRLLTHKPASYRVTQENDMAITGIIPGATGTFVATPLDSAGNPITAPLAVVPVWKSSDQLAVVTASADGLSCSVVVSAAAPTTGVNAFFSLTVSNPDGSASVDSTVPYLPPTTPPPPPPEVPASFSVSQTS
jgi:hypothetical protein